MRRFVRWSALILGLLLAVSFLGGSAVWHVLGLADDLTIEERAVPQDGLPGETLSPTQPFPTHTPPLVPSTIAPGDAFGVTLWDRPHP